MPSSSTKRGVLARTTITDASRQAAKIANKATLARREKPEEIKRLEELKEAKIIEELARESARESARASARASATRASATRASDVAEAEQEQKPKKNAPFEEAGEDESNYIYALPLINQKYATDELNKITKTTYYKNKISIFTDIDNSFNQITDRDDYKNIKSCNVSVPSIGLTMRTYNIRISKLYMFLKHKGVHEILEYLKKKKSEISVINIEYIKLLFDEKYCKELIIGGKQKPKPKQKSILYQK